MDALDALVAALVLGFLVATALPFALPLIDEDGSSITTTVTSLPEQAGPAAASGGTDGSIPTTSVSPPNTTRVRCTAPPVGTPATGLDEFPLTVAGETVTGENVSVAIVDPGGFAISDPRIEDQIAATESFATEGRRSITNNGRTYHGTATATTVARIVPDARLYLTNFETAYDFTRAVDWAIDRDVDVIVAPTAFYAKPNDGSAPVSKAVTTALDAGIPVVVPTGNVAQRHWEGTYTGGGWVEFAPNDTRLYLEGSDRPVQVWLWWNRSDTPTRHDFRVVLYRDLGNGSKRIAVSDDYPKGPVGTNQVLFEQIRTNNLLSESIGDGTYYIRIKGPKEAVHRVELVAAAHRIAHPVSNGSLMAPATARGPVIAVGAARGRTGTPIGMSSRGPTNDGRRGIDVIAPGTITQPSGVRFTGTSAATAYTGGVVAMLKSIDPTLTPAALERVLQESTVPAHDDLPNRNVGYGLVHADTAADCVS